MLYDLLWVSRTASDEQIKQHYKQLAKAVHPDRNEHQTELSNQTFREVENAFKILSNPITRTIYDNYGDRGLNIYDNYKEQFEELSKSDPEIKTKTIARYRVVEVIHRNTRALDQIKMQKVHIYVNGIFYFLLNQKKWVYPKPFARIDNIAYEAHIKYRNDASINIAIDGYNKSSLPTISHTFTKNISVNGVPFNVSLTNELTNPYNFDLEFTKWSFSKM